MAGRRLLHVRGSTECAVRRCISEVCLDLAIQNEELVDVLLEFLRNVLLIVRVEVIAGFRPPESRCQKIRMDADCRVPTDVSTNPFGFIENNSLWRDRRTILYTRT